MGRSSDEDLLNLFLKMNPQLRDSEDLSCDGNRTQGHSTTPGIATNYSGIKKSASEREFEAFLRPELSPNEDQSLKEEGIREDNSGGNALFSVHDVCCSDLGEMEDVTATKHGIFRSFAAIFGDRDTVNRSICAQVTTGLGWSHNPNPKQSSHASMSSGLSFGCTGFEPNGSPTSYHKPKTGDCQVQIATSGSSREQSHEDDFEIEAGPCEQSMGTTDLKRMRRMISNRESARRSRRRKQEQLVDLELQVDTLEGQNATLHKQLTDINQQCHEAATNNRVLRSDVEALRVTVKMAEDMLTTGTLTCNVNNSFQ